MPLILFAVNNAINVQHAALGTQHWARGEGRGANERRTVLALARINAANLRLSMV